MPITRLPTTVGNPYYEFEVELDGVEYKIQLRFNPRDASWYMTILNTEDAVLRAGIRVVNEWSLLRLWAQLERPAGDIVSINQGQIPAPPTLNQLGADVVLTYVDELAKNAIVPNRLARVEEFRVVNVPEPVPPPVPEVPENAAALATAIGEARLADHMWVFSQESGSAPDVGNLANVPLTPQGTFTQFEDTVAALKGYSIKFLTQASVISQGMEAANNSDLDFASLPGMAFLWYGRLTSNTGQTTRFFMNRSFNPTNEGYQMFAGWGGKSVGFTRGTGSNSVSLPSNYWNVPLCIVVNRTSSSNYVFRIASPNLPTLEPAGITVAGSVSGGNENFTVGVSDVQNGGVGQAEHETVLVANWEEGGANIANTAAENFIDDLFAGNSYTPPATPEDALSFGEITGYKARYPEHMWVFDQASGNAEDVGLLENSPLAATGGIVQNVDTTALLNMRSFQVPAFPIPGTADNTGMLAQVGEFNIYTSTFAFFWYGRLRNGYNNIFSNQNYVAPNNEGISIVYDFGAFGGFLLSHGANSMTVPASAAADFEDKPVALLVKIEAGTKKLVATTPVAGTVSNSTTNFGAAANLIQGALGFPNHGTAAFGATVATDHAMCAVWSQGANTEVPPDSLPQDFLTGIGL